MNERQQQISHEQCLDRGLLVSLRDGELTAEETARAMAHLELCADCAASEREVAAHSREVYDLLTTLNPLAHEQPEPQVALASLQARLGTENQHEDIPQGALSLVQGGKPLSPLRGLGELSGVGKRLDNARRQRRYGWLMAVAAVLIVLLILPNASALASQFLALFRVQQFQPVTIDVNPQHTDWNLLHEVQNFGDVHTHYTEPYPSNLTKEQAEKLIHFPLRLPSHTPPGVGSVLRFTVVSGDHATFTFSAEKTRAYLARTGQSSIAIPAHLDGATFSITLDSGVAVNYFKSCQTVNGEEKCSEGSAFSVGEIPSPVIHGPAKDSLTNLRSFLLSLPKLSPQTHDLLQHLDTQSGTIPVPVPAQVKGQQVTIQGTSGVLLIDKSMSMGVVLWQTHGIVYAVVAHTSDRTELLDSANSLR